MPRYIEFTTQRDDEVSRFARGNPIHDGIIPSGRIDVDGVRVDGETAMFQDGAIVNTLHRALYEAERLRERMVIIDCLAFVALMAGENLSTLPNQSSTLFPNVSSHTVYTDVGPSPHPLYLVRQDRGATYFAHAIHPAHTISGENYLHKLGVGPVAMSTLTDAATMYHSQIAVSMPTSSTTQGRIRPLLGLPGAFYLHDKDYG